MIREACIENTTFLLEYIKAGINRVELCDNLAVGGTTPSIATIEYADYLCKSKGIELAVMIRARGGDFVYKDFEKEIMLKDAKEAAKLKVDRIAAGALSDKGDVDTDFIEELVKVSRAEYKDIRFTFHMAFDHIGEGEADSNKSFLKRVESIKILAEQGFDIILTHGNIKGNPISENIEALKAYYEEGLKYSVTIMPGGGLSYENLEDFRKELKGVDNFHGTKIVKI